MDQIAIIFYFIHSSQIIQARSFAIDHNTIMCSNNACKKAETYDPLAIIMFQTFIIKQCDMLIHHRVK